MARENVISDLDNAFRRFRERVPVLDRRATDEGIEGIGSREDFVPLLFPHTMYKSYPEPLIAQGRWAQLNKWLDSLSAHRVDVDVAGVGSVDEWIDRLTAAGHRVSSSSGTSGKASFLNKSKQDLETSLQDLIDCLVDLGLPADNSWHVLSVGPETGQAQHTATREIVLEHYARPDAVPINPPGSEGALAGHHAYMSQLAVVRKRMASGEATPEEIAAVEAAGAERANLLTAKLEFYVEQIRARKDEKFLFMSTFPALFRLCEMLRDAGVRPGELTGLNAMQTGGGLKGATLPPDYQEQIFEMLNIDASRFLHYYSMQELNVRMRKCTATRYHVPDQLELFVLDQDGERLVEVVDGMAEGRAAFFDFTVDGRWGGTITGDKVQVDYSGTCPCGWSGITVLNTISRFSDLKDDDKITCAGTMDAYVRGFVED
jgi:hypothetical protein